MISIVTTCFNRALQMERGLQSVADQEINGEIIVVDDGSTDNTKEVFERLAVKNQHLVWEYIYLDHPEHRISSIPRNVGIKAARGEIVIFTEPECLHVGETINQLLGKMIGEPNRTPVATQVWTIQEKIYQKLNEDNFDRPITILNHPYAQLTTDSNLNNTKAPDSDWAITGSKNCLTGCLFACQKQWLLDIGGFDEEFRGHGFDDFDLFARLALYGKGVLPCDDIIVIHQWHEKNYPYNVIEAGKQNGTLSEQRIKAGEYRANIGKEWGKE